MKRSAILAVVFGLLVACLAGFWWLSGRSKPPAGRGRSKEEQKQKKDDDALPPLLFCQMAEQTRREVGITESPLAKKEGSKYLSEYLAYVTESDVRVAIRPGLYTDVPLIEMRFWKPGSSSELERVRVSHVRWGSWLNVPLEEGGGNVKDWGGCEVGAKAVRVPVCPEDKETDYMKLGHRHLVRMSVSRGEMYESVVRIPEDIPRGKMYVIDVIGKYPAWTFEHKARDKMQEQRKYIRGQIKGNPPVPLKEMRVEYFNIEKRKKRSTHIDADGTFKVRADDLGEMLRVTKPQHTGVGWLYIHSVKKRKLSLPHEADLVMRPEDLVEFHLQIPAQQVNDDLASIGLKVHRDDRVPMSWTNLTTRYKHPLESLQE
ncbi:MAG: hypothetical protein KGZ25_14210, partial [Planctomycetes bacterium]|nr:hypothetical protein [Planctomycetota bacterium]